MPLTLRLQAPSPVQCTVRLLAVGRGLNLLITETIAQSVGHDANGAANISLGSFVDCEGLEEETILVESTT
jgi:hypothetical protein